MYEGFNDQSQDVKLYGIRSYKNEDIVNAHQGRAPGMRYTFKMVSPVQRKLGEWEWPLHEINFQIKAKHVVFVDSVTTHSNRELG